MSAASVVSEIAPSRLRYVSSVMDEGLDYLNDPINAFCLDQRNDTFDGGWYYPRMAAPHHDWYFKQWLEYYGKKQAEVVKDLDWNKSKASLMFNDKQRYHRDDVNEVAAYLEIEPFELLLPPERAMALRQYRASAEQIVTLVPDPDRTPPAEAPHKPTKRTGTNG